MRLLAMSHAYVPDVAAGAETTLHDLLRAAVDNGHTVDVLLSENRGAIEPYELDGVRVWPYVDTGDPYRWIGTDQHPDLLVGQLQNVNRAAALARVHNIPLVHVVHNEMEHTRHAVRVGPSDLVVWNSQYVADAVLRWLDDMAEPRPDCDLVVHPPVRVEDYRITKPGSAITQINMGEVKGPDVFWEMAARFPDRQFLAVRGAYGVQDIRELPNVEVVGPFPPDQMRAKVYRRTKVLLAPSVYETYGRVAIEAACAGIPTIASDSPGLVEALRGYGAHVSRTDLDGWEKALRKLLSPRGYSSATKHAAELVDSLATVADLDRWVNGLEALARTAPVRKVLAR